MAQGKPLVGEPVSCYSGSGGLFLQRIIILEVDHSKMHFRVLRNHLDIATRRRLNELVSEMLSGWAPTSRRHTGWVTDFSVDVVWVF